MTHTCSTSGLSPPACLLHGAACTVLAYNSSEQCMLTESTDIVFMFSQFHRNLMFFIYECMYTNFLALGWSSIS